MEWSERCWAEVDLGALRRNYRQLRQRLSPGGKYLAVVKADAYGHGAVPVARVLQEEGADWFGVASLEEGEELRQGGITRPVLIFGYTPPQYAGRLAEEELTQGVFSAGYAAALGKAAIAGHHEVEFHLMVDTGMGRLGLRPREEGSLREAWDILTIPGLRCTGAFTHFAVADELGEEAETFTGEQLERFTAFCRRLGEAGLEPELLHCANSAATLLREESRLGMCRFGIVNYGLAPSGELAGHPAMPALEPAGHGGHGEGGPGGGYLQLRAAVHRPGATDHRHGSHRLRRRVSPVHVAGGTGPGEGPVGAYRRAGVYGPADGGCHRHPGGRSGGHGHPGGPGRGECHHLGRDRGKERNGIL